MWTKEYQDSLPEPNATAWKIRDTSNLCSEFVYIIIQRLFCKVNLSLNTFILLGHIVLFTKEVEKEYQTHQSAIDADETHTNLS